MVAETSDRLRKEYMGVRDDYWCKFLTFLAIC
jgi:hypothetical protein